MSDVNPDAGQPAEDDETVEGSVHESEHSAQGDEVAEATQAADPIAELTADLQRLQAEYANYRKRVERDRELMRDLAVSGVLAEFLPVLDDIGRARSHNELEGAFKSVGESVESTVNRLGLKSYGEPGDAFDPEKHEAIQHETSADVTGPTCVTVFQPGYEFAGRVIRAALVSVADPE